MNQRDPKDSIAGAFASLRADDNLYRNLVERATDGIAIVQDTLIKYVNPYLAATLGYPLDEILETPYTRYLTPESLDEVTAVYQSLSSRQETPAIYEATVVSKTGKKINFEVNTSVISFIGKPADFVIFRSLQERKERKRIAERMQQFQKLESLGVLAGGIAHDFNNLLQGMLGNADLALMYESDTTLVRTCLKDIKAAATRASDLAFQMLAYSGKGSFEIRNLNLNNVIAETAELLKVSISKKAVLRYDLQKSLPNIRADRAQLRQVIVNLVTNAAEAIGESAGYVTIKTRTRLCDRAALAQTYLDDDLEEGVYVVLEVTDTGAGMDETIIDKIFDPFFTTKFTGRGLGLAAVLGIVRAHLGAIQVDSDQERGTTFSVHLPVVERTTAGISVYPAPAEIDSQVPTILIVDDESTVRTTASRILERFGYNVVLATNGKSAIQIYREKHHRIDIVLLDMMMPHMDGKETFDELFKINNEVKTVLMSGYAEAEVKGRFVDRKPLAFLQKPFSAKRLIQTLKELTDS